MSDDAYTKPSIYKTGCQHRFGCRCETPYWLRESTPIEQRKEQRIERPWECSPCINSESSKPSNVAGAPDQGPVKRFSDT